MKHLTRASLLFVTVLSLLFLPYTPAGARDDFRGGKPDPNTCDSNSPRVRAVKLAAPIANTVDFSGIAGPAGTEGGFDPIPLLETKIYVGGKKWSYSCVVVHFSAQVNTGDNLVVFQASMIDGSVMPTVMVMEGHAKLPANIRAPLSDIVTPIVIDRGTILFDDGTTEVRGPTTASYNFFKIVKPGWYTVRIRWAGCCSDNPASVSAEALAAVMTIEYPGKDDD